ncbi:unnamed protein product, partial [Mesorhabditis spiculigera]
MEHNDALTREAEQNLKNRQSFHKYGSDADGNIRGLKPAEDHNAHEQHGNIKMQHQGSMSGMRNQAAIPGDGQQMMGSDLLSNREISHQEKGRGSDENAGERPSNPTFFTRD